LLFTRIDKATGILLVLGLVALASKSDTAFAADLNPIANSKAAAQKGKATYLRLCQYCHGFDGKAHENIDFQATNLTDLSGWKNGTEAINIFNSIKDGAGDDMPAFKTKATDEEIWQLVGFILSIGPEGRRPQNV
jgi:mono/diheme cytochrome c family protein